LALTLAAVPAYSVPRFTSTPETEATEGETYTYEVRTADTRGFPRQVSATTLPSWLTLSDAGFDGRARLSGTPTQAHVGTHPVTLRVTTLFTNQSATQSFTITVSNDNDPPVITGQTPNPIPLARNTSLTIQFTHLTVSDPDDVYPGGFSLTVLNGPNYSRNGDTITPATNFTGSLSVPVRVNDGAADSNTFILQVSVRAGNLPPEIVAPIPSQTVTENQPFQLRDAIGAPTTLATFFRDPDPGDTLRYEVSGLPPSGNLVVNETTGAITGTPRVQDARDTPYVVRVTANDGKSLASELPTQSFDLTIIALARPDITLSIAVTPAPAVVNTSVEWRFAIGNGSQTPAGPVELTAEFVGNPLSFGQVADCTVTPVMDRQRLVCTLASVGAGATATIIATGQAAQSGDVTATADAVLQGSSIDPNPANNHATATLNIAQTLSIGPAQILPSPDSQEAAAGDIDGDGFVDLALAKGAGSSAEFYLNVPETPSSTKRKLSETPTALGAAIPASDLALVDLDGDADLDLVMANNTGEGSAVFQNGGLGTFTRFATIDAGTSNGVAAADFDGNGLVDLVFANSGSGTVYLNGSGGTFTRGAVLGSDDSRKVVALDFDLDNLPDLVFANANGPSRFYRNLGSGNFAPGVVVDSGGAGSVASGDFNRDGRPDLVFGQLTGQSGPPSNPVYQNNPGANGPVFVLVRRLGASPTIDVLATDIDIDGPTDVVVITSTGTHQVYRGDGTGGFSLHPVQFSSATATGAALGRFSADARVDLVVGGRVRNDVFFNDGRGALGPGDTSAPVIQLVGDATVTLIVSSPYQDAGAVANDDIDGDLTSSIVTNNNVNTSVIGSYSVTYNVTDTSGNAAAQVTRTVSVGPREASGGGGGGALGALELVLVLFVVALGVVAGRRRAGLHKR
jgi:hypothetical protein